MRHFNSVSFVHYLYSTIVPEPHLPSVQLTAMAHFVCCGLGLVLVLLRGQFGAIVGHCSWAVSVIIPHACPQFISWRFAYTELVSALPALSSERLSLVDRASSHTKCLPWSFCWGCRCTDQEGTLSALSACQL